MIRILSVLLVVLILPAPLLCVPLAVRAESEITLVGTLRTVEATHPNGQTWRARVLTVDRPLTVTSDDGAGCATDERAEVQLAGEELPETWVGRRVKVTGAVFCEQTAWHIRPVLIAVSRFRLATR